MSDFHVHVEGLDEFVRRFSQAPRIIHDEIGKAARRSGVRVERRAKQLVPVDRGGLRRSISSKPISLGASVGTNLPYARAVEFGRGAGTTPPPVAPIAAWLKRKGGDPRLAFVVARAIGRRGIPGRPYLTKALDELKPAIRQEFAEVPKRVIARLRGGG